MTSRRGRRAKEPSSWAEFREWANLATAVAAAIVAAVSFWTTTRVSGIEDYLRSEIARRNSDLSRQARVADRIEARAESSRAQLDALQLETDRLIAAALRSQQELAGSGKQLETLRTEIGARRSQLAEAEGNLATAKSLADQQTQRLDAASRIRVARFVTLRARLLLRAEEAISIGPREEKRFPASDNFRKFIDALIVIEADHELDPYVVKLKEGLPRVCPDWSSRTYRLQAIPAPPEIPSTKGVKTREPANALMAEWGRAREAQSAVSKRALDDYLAQMTAEADYEAQCVCKALSDEKVSAEEICRGRG